MGLIQCIETNRDEVMLAAGRCYDCFRPTEACFCDLIPRIDNQTEVLILQHRRERTHPFNTARIVQKALRNSHLVADHTSNLALRLRLKPRAGLLYPGPSALPISELPFNERPEQLVVLDGTWHHAKTLLRDIPALQALPRYRLSPASPSRYRIRREPNATSLSTVEAAVAALRILEPETGGFDELLRAFDTMIDAQLTHSGSAGGQRSKQRRTRTFKNIPLALVGDLANVVVAYGETTPGERGCKRAAGPPIYWTAQRLASGETFSCALTPPHDLSDDFLAHLELSKADFADALSLDEARQKWADFERPTDIVTVIRPGTAHLYSYLARDRADCLVLKSVDLEPNLWQPSSQSDLAVQGNFVAAKMPPGRAGRRLAEAVVHVRHFSALAAGYVARAPLRKVPASR